LTGHEWERAPESHCGACPDRLDSFCKPPPTAEQCEQQHLEEGQKFKQQVQKQRADNQQRAAEAAKHKRKPGRPRKDAFEKSDAEGSEEEGSDAEGSEEGGSEEGGNEERDGEADGDDT